MVWYVIPELTEKGLSEEKLAEKHVPFARVTIKKPVDFTGIAIPDQYLPEVLKMIETKAIPDGLAEPTDLEGVFWLQVEVSPVRCYIKDPKIEKGAWLSCQKILKDLINPETKTEVIFTSVEKIAPITDGQLHIFIGAIPKAPEIFSEKGEIIRKISEGVFGFDFLPGVKVEAFLPSGEGKTIVAPEGTAVAEVIGKNIYILYALFHQKSTSIALYQLREILKRAIPLAVNPESDEAKEVLEEQKRISGKLYGEQFIAKRAKEIEGLLKKLKAAESALGKLSEEFLSKYWELEVKKEALKAVKSLEKKIKMRSLREFRGLKKTYLGLLFLDALSGFQRNGPVQKRIYLKVNQNLLNQERENLESAIAERKDRLEEISRRLVEEANQIKTKIKELNRIREAIKGEEKTFREELERISEMEGVKQVVVEKECVMVFTNKIFIEHLDEKFEIGHFRIKLGPKIKIENMDKKVVREDLIIDHPHIREGEPCFGNITEGVTKLLARFEYPILIQVILQWLKSYNESDAYGMVEEWGKEQ